MTKKMFFKLAFWGVSPLIVMAALSLRMAAAEEVKLFTKPPSADEMGALLFPEKEKVSPKPQFKTRSLVMTPAPSATPQPVEEKKKSVGIALPIQFALNSFEILDKTRPYLDEVGRLLNMEQFKEERIIIEGHTDAQGSENYNNWLSQERAKSVKNYLVSSFRVDPERLMVVGRGEREPLPDLNPNNGLNRRVELHRLEESAN